MSDVEDKKQRWIKGVDGAISILQALIAQGGTASSSTLAAELGLPRSSFHRIVQILAGAEILSVGRGAIGVGALAAPLIECGIQRLVEECQICALANPPISAKTPLAPATRAQPVTFSKPLRVGRDYKRFRIGFSNVSLDNPWRVALVHSVEHGASHLGARIARLMIQHADNDPARQTEQIRDLVNEGIDGLIVSADDSPLVSGAVAEAMVRGIEVVMVDRPLRGAKPTSFVSTSDIAIGRTTALWLAETLNGSGAILMLPGKEEAEPARLRLDAARAVFAGFPQIEILDVTWTGWLRRIGHAASARAIERFGRRISGVWCDSGLQGVGSMQAFVAAGWQNGHIPPHTGGDLNLAYKLAIKHNVRMAAVNYPPSMGIRAVEVLYSALRGRYVPDRVDVPSEVILTRGSATLSIQPQLWAEDHVRWDLPDELVLSSGLGSAYNPWAFRIHYPGNVYNRSAAQAVREVDA